MAKEDSRVVVSSVDSEVAVLFQSGCTESSSAGLPMMIGVDYVIFRNECVLVWHLQPSFFGGPSDYDS